MGPFTGSNSLRAIRVFTSTELPISAIVQPPGGFLQVGETPGEIVATDRCRARHSVISFGRSIVADPSLNAQGGGRGSTRESSRRIVRLAIYRYRAGPDTDTRFVARSSGKESAGKFVKRVQPVNSLGVQLSNRAGRRCVRVLSAPPISRQV